MSETAQFQGMAPPQNITLPHFVYGALKPGMPAFEQLRSLVVPTYQESRVEGQLFVRDGLPLLKRNGSRMIDGFLLRWIAGQESQAYAAICEFEPRKHYQWEIVEISPGVQVNVLVMRYPNKGNPQPLDCSSWHLLDDPAFGPGLECVRQVLQEVQSIKGESFDSNWQRFFRSQMAYLLLWSILERLTALCFGSAQDPMKRVKRLHELQGIPEAIRQHVNRSDRVSDSRDPDATFKLDSANAKKCFDYYYQVRSNLSHRGKGVFNEFDKVNSSLVELLAITEQYLRKLQEQEAQL